MRVAINGRFLGQPVTGVQRVGREFVHALDTLVSAGEYEGIDFEIVVPTQTPMTESISLSEIRVRAAGRLTGHAWEQFELPRLIGSDARLLSLGNTAPLWRLRSKTSRDVVMVHDLSYKYYPDAYSKAFRMLYGVLIPQVLAHADHVVTVSDSERTAILGHYGDLITEQRISAVQNGGGELAGRTTMPGGGKRGGCLYVGSLSKRKNARGLVRTAQLLSQHGVAVRAIGSTGAGLASLDADDVAARHVDFVGQVDDAETLRRAYRRAEVFLFPSFYEASPLPPIEAMANGCVVVCSDIPSLRERCGDAAVYFDPHSDAGAAEAVLEVLADAEQRERLRGLGHQRAEFFSWTHQVRRVMETVLR